MIPDNVKAHLAKPVGCVLGSCSAELRPASHRCYGLDFDDTHVWLFVASTDGLEQNVASNDALAVNMNDIATLETYQLKGTFVAISEPTAEQLAKAAAYAEGAAAEAVKLGYPEPMFRKYLRKPVAVVKMKVSEIYQQTPGPGAGKRIVPPEDAS